MGLRETFEGAAKAVFAAAGNVKISAVYKSLDSAAYDPTTGTVSEATTSIAVEVIRSELESKDKMGEHLDSVSGLYLILGEELGDVVPKPKDILVIGGKNKEVIDVVTDPIEVVWEIGV